MLTWLETLAILDGYSMHALRKKLRNSILWLYFMTGMIIPKELWAYVELGVSA